MGLSSAASCPVLTGLAVGAAAPRTPAHPGPATARRGSHFRPHAAPPGWGGAASPEAPWGALPPVNPRPLETPASLERGKLPAGIYVNAARYRTKYKKPTKAGAIFGFQKKALRTEGREGAQVHFPLRVRPGTVEFSSEIAVLRSPGDARLRAGPGDTEARVTVTRAGPAPRKPEAGGLAVTPGLAPSPCPLSPRARGWGVFLTVFPR